MAGDPKFEASQDLPDFPYAALRRAARAARHPGRPPGADRPGAGTRRSPRDRPVVIEAITDPDVPPLPPHITFEQARDFTSLILKGDPNSRGIDPPGHSSRPGRR